MERTLILAGGFGGIAAAQQVRKLISSQTDFVSVL